MIGDRGYSLTRIDYQLLAEAIAFYETAGYEYVELPYFVPNEIANLTFDGNGINITPKETLVGSAEQSFLYANLPSGRYVGCTPCFRHEPVYNELSQPHFMKVELFDNRLSASVLETMHVAQKFMKTICPRVRSEITSAGMDLMVDRIEVGSYGRRCVQTDAFSLEWVYGTGLALPRMSIAAGRR